LFSLSAQLMWNAKKGNAKLTWTSSTMSSIDTAPSSTFMDNWSDSILCSRNRPTYRCRRYRQHLFCRFSVQKLNHDIVCGTCKAVCDVFLAHNLLFYYLLYYFYNPRRPHTALDLDPVVKTYIVYIVYSNVLYK
jgi:hypothetical protein